MKYISQQSIVRSWDNIKVTGQRNRSSINKFVGFLELVRFINLVGGEQIQANFQYSLSTSDLSTSLQRKFFFSDFRVFNSADLYIIFPNNWEQNVFQVFLKNNTISILDIAVLCLQGETFPENFTTADVISDFKHKYHLSSESNILFEEDSTEIEFTNTIGSREALFIALKKQFGLTDNLNFTIGADGRMVEANPGELTRGSFIQPLYSGQENLKCLLMANFDLINHYNINTVSVGTNRSTLNIDSPVSKIYNKIIYGAPGTGKSYALREQSIHAGFLPENSVRVTFHPSYSYQQFVGTYKPTPIYRSSDNTFYDTDKVTVLDDPNNKEPLIDYSFVPGPLLIQLIKALKNPQLEYLLIIEEINRANASSVFGDVFQLLDRKDNGESEYEIQFNVDASKYLKSVGVLNDKIKLPKNLYIWASMNSADQGVLPLDAAFKRRWTFEYLPLDEKANVVSNRDILFGATTINWNLFRARLNTKLKSLNVPEDKLIAPFFLNSLELTNPNSIKNKLLLYLREDVVRHNPESLFKSKTFSDMIMEYDAGENVFLDIEFD